ncbi:heavy metal translocating P-type ATPase [Pseudomonas sp. WAC2]|uniref:heavy metal translocating P-type ATPase n=1 Tax=Pseudomonas sp. WAC2 TaxID=3055057 RepID=UPI0025B022A2|nr:heavy metal translocating P-type ATPase [Pseudomonas sp. WAC2]MDN3233781.1 heavy metal translocating P-type ATPase [Pseudomonas sp. WAC2]
MAHDSSCCGPKPSSCCEPQVKTCCDSHTKISLESNPLPGVTEPEVLDHSKWTSLRIDAMDCPTEEKLIRDAFAKLKAVEALEFNLIQRSLRVRHRYPDAEPLKTQINRLGMQAVELKGDEQASAVPAAKPWWPLGLGLATALAAEVGEWLGTVPEFAVAFLALAAIALAGLPAYRKGWIAIRQRTLNINALMSIAVTGALLIGHWPEAAMVSVLFAIAEVIEARSLDRARNAIQGLLALTPENATVRQADGTWATLPAKQVQLGALIRVRPGERIALDGEVESGQSGVNQAPITGESLPVDKAPGDTVFAGTINGEGSLEYRVTHRANESTLARIIHAVEQAQGARAPTQRFVDRFSRLYTPAVVLIAVAVALLPPLLGWGGWLEWLYKGLVLLVIACPCALVISTPVTIVSGLSAAARRGILVKGGTFLEQGRQLEWIALDKTGTLTEGKPQLVDRIVLTGQKSQALEWAASLSSRSDHPASQALSHALLQEGTALKDVQDFSARAGQGVQGRIEDQLYFLGNRRLLEREGLASENLRHRIESLEQTGKSVVALARQQEVLALFIIADQVKETSQSAVAALHALGIKTLVLSGDNPHSVDRIAGQVGIDEAHGSLLPEDKLAILEQKQRSGAVIGMVGDGINDAPALARANIGFAMGAAGTDTAIETADVALMDDDLRKLPDFIRLSRSTHRILMQNIALALGIKAIFLALTIMGEATLWMAVFADMGTSLLVVANGLQLIRHH